MSVSFPKALSIPKTALKKKWLPLRPPDILVIISLAGQRLGSLPRPGEWSLTIPFGTRC